MSLDEFDVKKEIENAFKTSISSDFRTLYNALIYKEGLPTQQVLHLIKSLKDESLLKETKKLELAFLEKQKHRDREENQKDLQEAQKDEHVQENALKEKQTLQQQLDTLHLKLDEQKQLHQKLQHGLRAFTTVLIDYSAFREAQEKPLEEKHQEIIKERRKAEIKAKSLTTKLDVQIKKLASETGLLTQIKQVKVAMAKLDATTFKELEERRKLREMREALRHARKEADELAKPIAKRLSSETHLEFQKELTHMSEKINALKAKLVQEVKTQIHSIFVDFLKDQFTSHMTSSKQKLQAVYEIARHIQTLNKNIQDKDIALSQHQQNYNAIKNPLANIMLLTETNNKLQNQIHITHFFKKSAILAASTSTLGAIGAIAVVALLLSTPPAAITASFLLLTAIAANALVIRLHQYQCQKEKEKQHNQNELRTLHANQNHRLTLENTIQNSKEDLSKTQDELDGRVLSAKTIYETNLENPIIYIPKLSNETQRETERTPSEASSRTVPAALHASPRSPTISIFQSLFPLEDKDEYNFPLRQFRR